MGPASFTPSVLQYGPEMCQHQSSVLNNRTQKAYTSTLHWMRLHNGAGQGSHCHTPPRGTDNTTAVPSRISAALFSNWVVVWGSSAGKESHIPEEGREPGRGGGLLGLRLKFPAGPRWHPRALLWPGHQAGYLVAIIWQWWVSDAPLWNFKAKQQLIYKSKLLNDTLCICIRKSNTLLQSALKPVNVQIRAEQYFSIIIVSYYNHINYRLSVELYHYSMITLCYHFTKAQLYTRSLVASVAVEELSNV